MFRRDHSRPATPGSQLSSPCCTAADDETACTESEGYVGEELFQTFCDDRCRRRCGVWTSIHACRTCVDTRFYDYCYEIVKASKPAFRKCNPDHEFFADLPGVDRGRRAPGRQQVSPEPGVVGRAGEGVSGWGEIEDPTPVLFWCITTRCAEGRAGKSSDTKLKLLSGHATAIAAIATRQAPGIHDSNHCLARETELLVESLLSAHVLHATFVGVVHPAATFHY
jgi:hypothetical protein